MNHRLWPVIAAVGLVLVALPAVAYGQEILTVNVPFPFVSQGKTHPAGEYRLSVGEDKGEVTIAPAKGPATVALIATRLASTESAAQADRVVFDRVGNTYYLSELWFAPGQDGFLLHATKEPHTHHVVKITSKAK
jgi:hypothetical protein